MEKSQQQLDREARYEKYCSEYSEQLRLMGYIKSLEADNESIRRQEAELGTKRAARRAKKLIKINNKDIKKYSNWLSTMPEAPPFK